MTTQIQQNTPPPPVPTKQSGSSASGSSDNLSNQFAALLAAQLKNQDPTEPMDSSALTTQLAQFSQLEQQEKSNSYLSALGSLVSNVGNMVSMGIVGSDAQIAVDKFEWEGKGPVEGTVIVDETRLDEDYIIEVKDSDGKVVRSLDATLEGGELVYEWDGKDKDGKPVNQGDYEFEVSYVNGDGKNIKDEKAIVTTTATISAMQYYPSPVTTLSNGMRISDAMILAITTGDKVDTPVNPDKPALT